MSDLEDLLARFKRSSEQSHPQSQPYAQGTPQQPLWTSPPYQQPSVSSPLFSPPVQTPNPVHASNIISPVNPSSTVGTPGPDSSSANNLLNLLKFNNGQPAQQQGQTASPMANLQNIGGHRSTSVAASLQPQDDGSSRPLSAADIVSSFQRSNSSTSSPMVATRAERTEQTSSSHAKQDFLLNLFTKPNAQQSSTQSTVEAAPPSYEKIEKGDAVVDSLTRDLAQTSFDSATQARSQAQREPTPVRNFDKTPVSGSPFEAPKPTKASMFNYVNPFEQLNSSSPLNRTPKPEASAHVAQAVQPKKIEILKHNREASTNNSDSTAPSAKSRKIDTDEVLTDTVSATKSHQSVSEALEDVADQVDKQVEQALAEAGADFTASNGPARPIDGADDQRSAKKETTAEVEVESSWESAEDDRDKDFKVEVYNFPMKPFVSLQIKPTQSTHPIRQDNFMVIAQLKKEFDQIDRCLVTSSQTHIVYAQVATKKDNGGFRIIRQDSGDHKQVFRSSGERIFSVQLCSSPGSAHDVEAVLGTGVNGSVFWTSLAKSRGDLFPDDDVEAHGFIMPPVQTVEENTSGSPVKTRAKMSSRHPDFFAIARGKQIFIVSPETVKDSAYCNKQTRKVNSEQYFKDHCFKINTGKAGKDFCFSEDDSVIVSLDKNGRFKFWEVGHLIERAGRYEGNQGDPLELKDPLWTLMANASGNKPDEKPSVSSITFLDKERPYIRGSALRYMIIGFRQNHILQLWDLGLGKAVQEIRLPHEKDSDGICSISYHPKSGIITVGHPTRNSIYFIHLSAPKYNIPQMEQAKYIRMLANNESGLPKPDSTAIMSGLREFSFAKVGQLRSVDMLRTPVENASERNSADETLFELYVMHSKGVVGISIKRDDLGWDAQSKMVNPKDGLKEGVIEVSDLIQVPKLATSSEQNSNADTSFKIATKPAVSKKTEPVKQPAPPRVEVKKESESAANSAPTSTPRLATPEPASKQSIETPSALPIAMPGSYATAAQHAKSPAQDAMAEEFSRNVDLPQTARPGPVVSSGTEPNELQGMLSKEFDALYQRIETDKRVQDAAAGAKQDALLRLVSSTLTENVDRVLSDIITSRIEKDVTPSLTEAMSKVADRKISESLPQQLHASIGNAMKQSLPQALQQALQHALKDKEVHRTIAEVTANSVAQKVQHEVSSMLQQSLPNMATQAAQTMITDLEHRMTRQQHAAEAQRRQDNAKIEELSNTISSLSSMIQDMASRQSAFQEQILKTQNQTSVTTVAPSTAPAPEAAPEDAEVAEMTQMLMDKDFEQVTIKWISSDHQAELFDKLFVRVNPAYLEWVSPLVALTVSAAITSSFDTYIEKRLDWLSLVLSRIDIRDEDIRDVAPKIMDVLSSRLQGIYMQLSEERPDNPLLKTISGLNKQVTEIRRLAQ